MTLVVTLKGMIAHSAGKKKKKKNTQRLRSMFSLIADPSYWYWWILYSVLHVILRNQDLMQCESDEKSVFYLLKFNYKI